MAKTKAPVILEVNGPQMNVPAFSEQHQALRVFVHTVPNEAETHYEDFYGQGPVIIRRVDL